MAHKDITIKPTYYDTFQCIADKCSISCCKEWKIEVDDATYKKWGALKLQDSKESSLQQYVNQKEGCNTMNLTDEKNCPFLNKQSLCKLVTQFGDEVLSKTCTTFPREIHTFHGRTEYSLVACCPEVVDLLSREKQITLIGNDMGSEDDLLFQIRSMLIAIIQEKDYSIEKGIMMSFYMLLDLLEKETLTKQVLQPYKDRSMLNELSKVIDKMEFSRLNTVEEKNELFLDLAENYRKEQLYTSFLEEKAVAAENLFAEYEEEQIEKALHQFEEQFLAYEPLFRNYLAAEFFHNTLLKESELEDLVIKFQWISLEYTVIKHVIFLQWLLRGETNISYESVRDTIVIISRMTGYEEEDICEYLENSFEELFWEWGYLALIIGNN